MAGTSISERLAFLITANGSDAVAEFQRTGAAANTSLRVADNSSARLSQSLVRVGAGMAAVGAVGLIGLYKAAEAAEEDNIAVEKLNNSVQRSPELAGASTDAFLDQADALQDVTTYQDDVTVSAQAMLGTLHLTQQEIIGLIPRVQDLASKKGLDLTRAAQTVGKAMEGNIGILGRMGVSIDENAFATDRYTAIMNGLRETAGGFAEREGRTFDGQVTILKNNLGELEEGVGRGSVRAFDRFVTAGQGVVDVLDDISPGAQEAIGEFATYASVGLVVVGSGTAVVGSLLRTRAAYVAVKAAAAEAAAAEVAAGGAAKTSALGAAALPAALIVGAAALAIWARSLDGVTVDIEEFSGATEDQMVRAAEAIAAFGQEGEVLEQLFDIDPAAAQRFVNALGQVADNDEARQTVADLQNQLDGLNHSAELSALGLDETATSAEEAAARVDALNRRISEYVQRALGLGATQDDLQASFNDLYEQLLDNGGALDGNTQAAIANRQSLRGIVEDSAAVISTLIDQGATEERLQRVKANSISRIRQTGEMMGWGEDKIRSYIQAIDRIPGSARTQLTVDQWQALAAINEIERRLKEVAQANYTAHIRIMQDGGFDTPGLGVDQRSPSTTTGLSVVGGRSVAESRPGPRTRRRQRQQVQPVVIVGGR